MKSTTLTLLTVALTLVAGNPTIPVRVDAFQAAPVNATDLLLKAKTVSILGVTGKQMRDRAWANPNGARGKEKVVAVLTEWGRYQILEDPATADLIVVVTEVQKNLNLLKRANLVAELRVYPGGAPPGDQTPVLWSGDAGESFRKMPSTQAAENFKDHVIKLETSGTGKK